MRATLSALTGYLLLGALAVCLGAVACRWLIVPRVSSEPAPTATWLAKHTASLGLMASGALTVALGLFLARQLVEFRDPVAPLREDVAVLLSGAWGTTWEWGVAASCAAIGGFAAARAQRAAGWLVASGAVIALSAFPAFTGHAAGQSSLRIAALIADTLHVVAAGGWIGLLALFLFLEWRWRAEAVAGRDSLLPRLVPAFSPVAMACVATLVVTGAFGSWLNLPSLLLAARVVLFVTAVIVRTSPMDH